MLDFGEWSNHSDIKISTINTSLDHLNRFSCMVKELGGRQSSLNFPILSLNLRSFVSYVLGTLFSLQSRVRAHCQRSNEGRIRFGDERTEKGAVLK